MEKKAFGLYKKGNIYYMRFRDENGKRCAISTGQRTKTAARAFAERMFKEDKLYRKSNIYFSEFSRNWWVSGACEYVKLRRRKYRDISPNYIDTNKSYLDNHILPYFGNMKLSKIKPEHIEKWHEELVDKKKLSPTTANHCLSTLKIMLNFAVQKGYLSHSPGEKIVKFKERQKEKGILTVAEFKQLFDETKTDFIWENDLLHYTINLLVANTGLRMGELRALTVKDVDINKKLVFVRHSFRRKYGIAEPKWGSSRIIPIPAKVSKYLKIILDNQDYKSKDDFIFYGKESSKPIDEKAISKHLYRALEKIGISDKDRIERNITFHSCRHFYNTYLYDLISINTLRSLTGHKSKEMSLHYYHEKTERDFREVYKVLEDLNAK